MQQNFSFIHLLYLAIAIIFDVIANVFLKLSHGFKNKMLAFFAIIFVLAAFTALSFAVEGIQLSIAYGIWGGLGLLATAIFGMIMFQEKLQLTGWIGIILIIGGVTLMKFSHLF